jgi:hypothetical protein
LNPVGERWLSFPDQPFNERYDVTALDLSERTSAPTWKNMESQVAFIRRCGPLHPTGVLIQIPFG